MADSFQEMFKGTWGGGMDLKAWRFRIGFVETSIGKKLALITVNDEVTTYDETPRSYAVTLDIESWHPRSSDELAELIDQRLQLAMMTLRDLIRQGVKSNG